MAGEVWDPFEGRVAYGAPLTEGFGGAALVRQRLGAVGPLVLLAGFVVMIAELIGFAGVVVAGVPVIGTAGVVLGAAMLMRTGDAPHGAGVRVAARVALAKGWAFQAVRQRNRPSDEGCAVARDPAMEAAYAALGPILLRAVTPVNPQALLRGQHRGRDLWIGVEQMSPAKGAGWGLGGGVSLRAVVGMRTQTQGRFVADLSMPVRLVDGAGPEAARMAVEPALSGPLLDYGGARMVVQPGAIFVSFPRYAPVKDPAAWIEARVGAVARVADGFEGAA